MFCAIGVAASVWSLGLLEAGGCSPAVTANLDEQSDNTIGAYCDRILPTFCAYAVDTCGSGTTQARCIVDARPICCQGTCSRPARLVKNVDDCLHAYAGDEAGIDEVGVEHEAGVGQPCNQVQAGLAPVACQEVVELLTSPEPGTAGPGVIEAVARGVGRFGRAGAEAGR